MINKGLNFYRVRLKNASFPEIAHRVRQGLQVSSVRLQYRFRKEAGPRRPSIETEDISRLAMPELQGEISPETVKWIMGGGIYTLAADVTDLKDAEECLRKKFCTEAVSSVACRDIRQLWEPARLQHVTALIANLGKIHPSEAHEEIRKHAEEVVLGWIDANPFLWGPHHASAMECGLRIPVFFYSLKCLVEQGSSGWNALLDATYQHAWWISKRLSLHSSLGNHTVAECAGLVFAGAIFRGTREGKGWLDIAIKLLEKEISHQILLDGGPAEQSLNYHRFVLDLYWLAVDFLEKNGLHDCSAMKPCLAEGEKFLSAFGGDGDEVPSIGDSDDGHAVAPDLSPRRQHLEITRKDTSIFRETGYTIARSRKGISLTFDHGPLGMAPLYNHGHADALSVTVSVNGKMFLVDPGTFRYNGDPVYRKYFKGTGAHNTVTVDGLDQAVQETGFIWSHPYSVELTSFEERTDQVCVEAVHDGYRRLSDPVLHKRSLMIYREGGVIIRDSFVGEGVHAFDFRFHLHPDAVAECGEDWVVISRGGDRLFLKICNQKDYQLICGQENPPMGWFSPRYGVKVPAGVLRCSARGKPAEVSFVTLLSAGDTSDRRKLEDAACRQITAA